MVPFASKMFHHGMQRKKSLSPCRFGRDSLEYNAGNYPLAESPSPGPLAGVVMLADLLTKAASRAIFTGLIKQLDDFHAL